MGGAVDSGQWATGIKMGGGKIILKK